MTFVQALARENSKYEILSYSLIVTVFLYLFGADAKVFGSFVGGTIYLTVSWLMSGYSAYRKTV